MNVDPVILKAAIAHAKECAALRPPRESCGVAVRIDGTLRYWPCNNIADPVEQAEDAVFDPDDLAAARQAGTVELVIHSHIRRGPEPSPADVSICEQGKVPWLIVTPSGKWHLFAPCGATVPLAGRRYVYGIHDCATLVRDWYAIYRDVRIEIMPTEPGWWLKGKNYLAEHIEAQGFRRVALDALQPGDVLLLQIECDIAHHCAIWLGNGRIFHHLRNRVSREDLYGTHWQQRTRSAWRHACAD